MENASVNYTHSLGKCAAWRYWRITLWTAVQRKELDSANVWGGSSARGSAGFRAGGKSQCATSAVTINRSCPPPPAEIPRGNNLQRTRWALRRMETDMCAVIMASNEEIDDTVGPVLEMVSVTDTCPAVS